MGKDINNSIFYLFLVMVMSCSTEQSFEELEQQVYEDVFPELIGKVFTDFRKLSVPPPPPKDNSKEETDKMHLAFEKAKENHKKYLDTTSFAPLYIVLSDSVKSHSKKTLQGLSEYSGIYDYNLIKKPFKLKIGDIDLGDGYIIIHESDLELPLNELESKSRSKYSTDEKHLQQYSGMLHLYRVYFNENKDYGIMQVGYDCGKLCGCGYVIFVKKINNKWKIDALKSTGCA